MHSINEIRIDHIVLLSPEQLSELLHCLLKIEVGKNSLENWKILVPKKINVADGGEDGRISWTGDPAKTTWIKNKLTIFQCKAGPLIPSKCYEEILEPKVQDQSRKLKSQVEDVVVNNGCYTLFTSQDLNTQEQNKRISEFRRAIQDAGHPNYKTFEIRVYDANQIKDWINENISAVTFVQSCIGITRDQNFRTWSQWKNDMPGSHIPYQLNDVLLKNLDQIRLALEQEKIVRIIGHSGLGKTRMVLEAFRENPDKPDIKALQDQLVYYDIGLGNLEKLYSFILSQKDVRSGIIVVDNCDENAHNAIAGLIKSSGNFKVITIDFSSETSERSVIKMDREKQRDIVQKIVETEFQDTLTKTDKDFIANQSEGYPQMAILFSNSVRAGGLDGLNSRLPYDFLTKLIFGRNNQSDFEFEIIKACSVLSNFGFVDDNISTILKHEEKEFLTRQTDYVRTRICGGFQGSEVTSRDFYRICLKYKKTNIIEQRGSRIMVRPTPLAINLATLWWKETPYDLLKEILSELKDNELGKRLVERLAMLDQLDKAKEIVNELWGPNSPFGTEEVLNTSLGSLLFRYVVEVNPIATAKTLKVVFGNMTKDQVLKIDEGRRNLVWALEKLCFRKETFSTAAKILYLFAVSENETWADNSTNQLIQLFQLFLPGTEANLVERLEIIKWGLNKHDDKFTEVAIHAMGRGLLNDHHTRMGGAEKQGSGIPLEDYRPHGKEITEYWTELLNLLTEISCSKHPLSELAKKKISNSIRTLIRDGQFDLLKDSIKKIVTVKNNLWAEALKSLKMTLNYENNLPSGKIKQIEDLIIDITPTDVKNQLLIKVSRPEWDSYEKDEYGRYIDKPKLNAERFAQHLIKNKINWLQYIEDLLKDEQRQGFNFGAMYSSLVSDKQGIIEKALYTLKKIEKENQNPEFLAGLLYGSNDQRLLSQTIDRLIPDDDLRQHSFYITRVLNAKLEDILKLFALVEKYDYSINQFQIFKYGRALSNLSSNEVVRLCQEISKYGNAGKWTSLSVLYMFCYNDEEKWQMCKDFFKYLISNGNMVINNENTGRIDSYYWSDTVTKILLQGEEQEFAITISKQIVEFCSQSNFIYSFESDISNAIVNLFEKYFDSSWEIFGTGIIGDYKTFFHLEQLIGTGNGHNDQIGLAFQNPQRHEAILKWCRKHPNKAPERIAHMIPLSVNENGIIKWHPFSKTLIDEFGDCNEFLNQLSSNMGTFTTVGSRIPYFTTQKKLLEELINHRIPRVREWAKKMLDYTEKIIKREKLDEEDYFQS